MSLTLAETVVDGLVLPGSRKSDPASRNHTPSDCEMKVDDRADEKYERVRPCFKPG